MYFSFLQSQRVQFNFLSFFFTYKYIYMNITSTLSKISKNFPSYKYKDSNLSSYHFFYKHNNHNESNLTSYHFFSHVNIYIWILLWFYRKFPKISLFLFTNTRTDHYRLYRKFPKISLSPLSFYKYKNN